MHDGMSLALLDRSADVYLTDIPEYFAPNNDDAAVARNGPNPATGTPTFRPSNEVPAGRPEQLINGVDVAETGWGIAECQRVLISVARTRP